MFGRELFPECLADVVSTLTNLHNQNFTHIYLFSSIIIIRSSECVSYSAKLNISAWTLSNNFVLPRRLWLFRFCISNSILIRGWLLLLLYRHMIHWLLLLALLLFLRSVLVMLGVWLQKICFVFLFLFHFMLFFDWFGMLFSLGGCFVGGMLALLPSTCN